MRIAGHTMGTPELTLEEAAALFKRIGLDAIEIVYQEGYGCGFSGSSKPSEIAAFKRRLDSLGLAVSCMVPYASDYNQPDAARREAAMAEARRCLEAAEALGAGFMRIYGGTFLEGEPDFDLKRRILVESMRELGAEAAARGVTLALENHFNTMTSGPGISAEIVREIDRASVRILYDQANITFLSGEDYRKSVALQKGLIGYVHVKDLVFKDGTAGFKAGSVTHVSEDERAVSSRVPGDGVLPWGKILGELRDSGYDGYLSLEYERRWHPADLPPAEIGMRRGAEHIRRILAGL